MFTHDVVEYKGKKLKAKADEAGVPYPVQASILQFVESNPTKETIRADIESWLETVTAEQAQGFFNSKLMIDARNREISELGLSESPASKKSMESAIMAYATATDSVRPRFVEAAKTKKTAGYYDTILAEAEARLGSGFTVPQLEGILPEILTD